MNCGSLKFNSQDSILSRKTEITFVGKNNKKVHTFVSTYAYFKTFSYCNFQIIRAKSKLLKFIFIKGLMKKAVKWTLSMSIDQVENGSGQCRPVRKKAGWSTLNEKALNSLFI